ncbi:hypothetical protein EDD18DRAFT_1103689 [Armillaria luteobubalina]|uniref:Uncharacterized protein n=1 Tax=Armillaria luteobubalina TaxID=153913 RepID=A0AA39Q8U7_9AGAR|nr:hypothetical protein EDD18DRAFT_1103689 [Armillaria luteobubalina]
MTCNPSQAILYPEGNEYRDGVETRFGADGTRSRFKTFARSDSNTQEGRRRREMLSVVSKSLGGCVSVTKPSIGPTEVRVENGKPIRHEHDGGILLEGDERVEDDLRERICAVERGECWETVKEIERAWKRLGDEVCEAEMHVLRICEEY